MVVPTADPWPMRDRLRSSNAAWVPDPRRKEQRMSIDTSPTRTTPPGVMRRRRLLAVTGATAAALAAWTLTGPVAGIDMTVHSGETVQAIGPGAVITASLVAGLAAWASLAVLERFVTRPRRTWSAIALTVFVLSLAGPLVGGVDTASKATLAGLHVIVAAVLILVLRSSTR
jgi:hypothetical protein